MILALKTLTMMMGMHSQTRFAAFRSQQELPKPTCKSLSMNVQDDEQIDNATMNAPSGELEPTTSYRPRQATAPECFTTTYILPDFICTRCI
jgi:hypothetical protein